MPPPLLPARPMRPPGLRLPALPLLNVRTLPQIVTCPGPLGLFPTRIPRSGDVDTRSCFKCGGTGHIGSNPICPRYKDAPTFFPGPRVGTQRMLESYADGTTLTRTLNAAPDLADLVDAAGEAENNMISEPAENSDEETPFPVIASVAAVLELQSGPDFQDWTQEIESQQTDATAVASVCTLLSHLLYGLGGVRTTNGPLPLVYRSNAGTGQEAGAVVKVEVGGSAECLSQQLKLVPVAAAGDAHALLRPISAL
ncbi:hypothetical protein C8R44DRAFT_732799 [Mycena epipterygia]|nr:hypothetical protein C8R44DRAFT_732799 [Mycena epipterygia]